MPPTVWEENGRRGITVSGWSFETTKLPILNAQELEQSVCLATGDSRSEHP